MKVLALAGDAGGARALAPVAQRLRTLGIGVECRAYGAALGVFSAAGLPFGPVTPEIFTGITGFDRVLTATSVNAEQWELWAVEQAAAAGVPSLCVLDFWSSYRERFTAHDGRLCLPDRIAVMDDRARDEMVREGFPGERLAVTGQPALDDLSGYLEPAARKAARLETRHLAGCRSEERCVLFASQPLSDVRSPEELGFHHRDVLRHVVIELGRVLDRRASRATLVIRPHPREIDRPYLLPTPTTDHLTLVYLPDLDVSSRTLAVGSDLVVGMNSMLLQEACLMRAPVLSYQPGLRVEEMLPANRYGWSRAVYERGNLAAALEAELFDQEAGVARRRILDAIEPPVGATERVTDLLLDAA